MLKRIQAILIGLAGVFSLAGHALACPALEQGDGGRVVAVTDGDTIDLDSGVTVRLVGIQAPKLPLGREGFVAWPLGDEAKAALETLVLGETVTLHYGGERVDRHGRALAHVFVAGAGEPVWAQGEMLAQGLARVYSFPDNRSCLADMYAIEAQARADGRGIWTDPFYQLRDGADHEALLARVGEYELVEGRVLNAANAAGRVYLNFGSYWKEDFTVVVEGPAQRVFESEQFDLIALENRVIRVRGWVDELDGPRMVVTHPEQIEILGPR